MNFFEVFQSFSSNVWIYAGTFLLVLGILVFVHEWGHYIVAKLCGVKVEVFSVGFGKELFGFHDKSGTRWKICMVPLGGYVKMFGDVDPASVTHKETVENEVTHQARPMTAEERKVAFFAKPVWKRAAIVVAGPAINYIFAILLLTFLFAWNGQPVTPPLGAAVIAGSAADKNGFKPHDFIISIDGKKIEDFEDIRIEMMISLDQKRHFEIERDGKVMDIYAQPQKIELSDRFGFKHSRGVLGLISPRHAIDISSIKKIDGREYTDVDQIRDTLVRKMGETFTIEATDGSTDKLIIKPLAEFNKGIADPESRDFNHIYIANQTPNVFVKYSPIMAFVKSLEQAKSVTTGTLRALGQMVMGMRSPTELGGIIRIGAMAGDMAQQGIIALIMFTALLSFNLGLINLFPIPILDGGHLVFYAFEAVLGRPIPERIQEYAFRFGLTFLVCIMVFANLSDIMQLIL